MCALTRKIRCQEYSPVLTRGHYTLMDISEWYRVKIQTNVITGSMEIALYIILNALRYVQPIKLKQIEFVCYRKYINFLFPRTTFVVVEFQTKKKIVRSSFECSLHYDRFKSKTNYTFSFLCWRFSNNELFSFLLSVHNSLPESVSFVQFIEQRVLRVCAFA